MAARMFRKEEEVKLTPIPTTTAPLPQPLLQRSPSPTLRRPTAIRRTRFFSGLNRNNNRLGHVSSGPVRTREKVPSILSMTAFFFAIVDIIIASICTWYWYPYIWFLACPAFAFGMLSLTFTGTYLHTKTAILALVSLGFSFFALCWGIGSLIVCQQYCACAYFGDKWEIYNELFFRETNRDANAYFVPCVYVKFPPMPVESSKAEKMEFCFSSPIQVATYGFLNGYEARDCKKAPENICKVYDWYYWRREEEVTGQWAWIGKYIFGGKGDKGLGGHCQLDTDCKGFPENKCFGENVEDSICANGTERRYGEHCQFDRQCGENSDINCPTDGSCNAEFKTLCSDGICIARENCVENHGSEESPTFHGCTKSCSCCAGCGERAQCVFNGGAGWECECGHGNFGPHCKYGANSTDVPGGQAGLKGMCALTSKLCENNSTCRSTEDNLLGFRCECPDGWQGLYCDRKTS